MKNKQEQRNNSGKIQIGLLVAIALAAGGMGVWSELQAAGATVTKVGGYQLFAFGNGAGEISENGDGTASTFVGAYLEDGSLVRAFDDANTNFSISASAKRGQSGTGTGSGTGSATMNGLIFSPDFTSSTPAVVEVGIAVAGATEVSAFLSKGLNTGFDPLTGATTIYQNNTQGTQYYGGTAGSIAISVDGSAVYEESDMFGGTGIYSIRSIVRIR